MKKGRKNNFIPFLFPAGLVLGIIMGELTDNIPMGITIGALLGVILSFLVGNIVTFDYYMDKVCQNTDCRNLNDNLKKMFITGGSSEMRRFLIGLGSILLMAELLINRLIMPLSAGINIAICVIAAIFLIAGIVQEWKENNKK